MKYLTRLSVPIMEAIIVGTHNRYNRLQISSEEDYAVRDSELWFLFHSLSGLYSRPSDVRKREGCCGVQRWRQPAKTHVEREKVHIPQIKALKFGKKCIKSFSFSFFFHVIFLTLVTIFVPWARFLKNVTCNKKNAYIPFKWDLVLTYHFSVEGLLHIGRHVS